MTLGKDKRVTLLKLKGELQKKYGENAVMFASEIPKWPAIPTGSLALDFATGVGGFPQDRVIEIAGAEGCGKTTLALFAMMNVLDSDPTRGALILDTEHKLTPDWVAALIGDERMQRVLVAWPDHIEQATDMYIKAVSGGDVSFVMLDSIGGSPSMRSTEKSAEIAEFGGNAQGVSRFSRLASGHAQKYRCMTVGINQVRVDMEGYHRHITPGGNAWKHACVLRLLLKKGQGKEFAKIDGEDVQVGYTVVAKVVKNQLAAPGRVAQYWFYNVPTDKFGFGIDRLEEIGRLAILTGLVEVRGGWYYHDLLPGGKIQTKGRFDEYVAAHADIRERLSTDVVGRLKDHAGAVAPISSDPEGDVEVPDNILRRGEEVPE